MVKIVWLSEVDGDSTHKAEPGDSTLPRGGRLSFSGSLTIILSTNVIISSSIISCSITAKKTNLTQACVKRSLAKRLKAMTRSMMTVVMLMRSKDCDHGIVDDHKDHDDHDTDEGLDASSNGEPRWRWKRTFASPFNSLGDHWVMIYLNYHGLRTMLIFIIVHLNKMSNFISWYVAGFLRKVTTVSPLRKRERLFRSI